MQVDFGPRFFGDSTEKSFEIYNNGPIPAKYLLRCAGLGIAALSL
jgi:hypothetical protein